MADTFKFELVTPERLLISESVVQVLVPGAEGDFTVLPLHAPMLSTLRPGVIDVGLPGGNEQRIFIRSGIAEVGPENLTILAQRAVDLDDLDREWLSQEIKNAEEDVTDADDEDKRTVAQNTLDRLKQIEQAL